MNWRNLAKILGIVGLTAFESVTVSSSYADVDNVVTIVNKADASGTQSIGTFGYDSKTDSIFTSTFGAGGAIRRITNLNGTPVSTRYATETQIQLYYRDGDPDDSVSSPTMFSLLINPKAIGDIPANSFAVIAETAVTRFGTTTGSGTDPVRTKRFYNYNLQPLVNGPTSPTSPFNDGRDIFTTRVTLSDMQNALTPAPTSTTTNNGRQPVFSGDGQSIYFADTSTAFGGIWKVGALSGAPTRIVADEDVNVDAAVTNVGNVDTIYLNGSETANPGGIDIITHNLSSGVTTGRTTFLAGSQIANFLEIPVSETRSILADEAGNLYFNYSANKGIFKYDTQGRLSKVVGRLDRENEFFGLGNVNANATKLQMRSTNYTNGLGDSFPVQQLLYLESTGLNLVAGAYLFEPGDFNRDNSVSSADIALFKGSNALTTRGILMSTATPANFKFDMNGNAVCDWKDIKIMQQFFDFGDGDANLNGIVDFADFQTLQNNFGLTGKTFFEGDFNGDNTVTFADFQILQNSFNYQSSILNDFSPALFDQNQWDAFVTAVPEPSTYAMTCGVLVGLGLLRRRSKAGQTAAVGPLEQTV